MAAGGQMSDLVELLAALEHEQWAHWMKYLFSQLEGGKIPEYYIKRWQNQMKTPYENLCEKEKQSDRVWAHRTLAQLKDWFREELKEGV